MPMRQTAECDACHAMQSTVSSLMPQQWSRLTVEITHRTIENGKDKYLKTAVDKYYCPACAKTNVNAELEALKL